MDREGPRVGREGNGHLLSASACQALSSWFCGKSEVYEVHETHFSSWYHQDRIHRSGSTGTLGIATIRLPVQKALFC